MCYNFGVTKKKEFDFINGAITLGRPTDYRPEYNNQAYKLCLLGHIDREMAEFFGVSEATFNIWKKKHSSFMESLRMGKEVADCDVAESLYHKARGFSHPEEKIFCSDGEVITYETRKQYPPDTGACMAWLKNRQPRLWREKQELETTNINTSVEMKQEDIIKFATDLRTALNSKL